MDEQMESISHEPTQLILEKLTLNQDVFGDTAAQVGEIVESPTGVRASLLLGDTQDLQKWPFAHKRSSYCPTELGRRTRLCRAEHAQVGSRGKGGPAVPIHR